MLTCKEVIEVLADYLEASLTPEVVEQLERHLQECPPCLAYLNTYRRTRDLTGKVAQVEMPDELKSRLRQLLLERLRSGSSYDHPAIRGDVD